MREKRPPLGTWPRRLTASLAALTASVLLAVAVPVGAEAAPASCSGRTVRTLAFSTGRVQVHRAGGSVCAVTLQKHPGGKRRVSVGVQARGLVPVRRARVHTRSSLPVTVHAGHRCVRVSGSVGGDSFTSGWILC